MSDENSQTMKNLLEKMSASLVSAQAPRPVQHPVDHATAATERAPRSRPVQNKKNDEDQLVRHISALLDERLRTLEERTLKPLMVAVDRMDKRCARIEGMLQEQSDMKTVTVDLHQNGKRPPHRFDTSALTSATPKSEIMTRQEMQRAMELLTRLTRGAPSTTDTSTPHQTNVDTTPEYKNRPRRRRPASSDIASSWSGGSSSIGDSESEQGSAVAAARGAKYDQRDIIADNGWQHGKSTGGKVAERKVEVHGDSAAIRTLEPRPCHQFYLGMPEHDPDIVPYVNPRSLDVLAKSGCARPACERGHHYRLTKEHLKYMKQLVEKLPCKALMNGVVCRDGDDCIYSHKCPSGWICHFGDKCRFFSIPGGHPHPGDYHKKQNYYDSKKGSTGHQSKT